MYMLIIGVVIVQIQSKSFLDLPSIYICLELVVPTARVYSLVKCCS
ncbi:unnamed protein product [Haemonchus placei]|uniref:Uncharacterized protein n=1 Tax=Haemonchus placei TaxID=6290 RepID=A0A0N4VXJ4_HAEPC|nr:unnamed protein product [Haemonchus placei]